MISGPGDCNPDFEVIEEEIRQWNSSHSRTDQVLLVPWTWSQDSIPNWGQPGQSIINQQANDADIIIAVFRSRLGSPTQAHESGTVEEIVLAHAAAKPVHALFWDGPQPGLSALDLTQLKALSDFKARAHKDALTADFRGPEQLRTVVRRALEADVRLLRPEPTPPTSDGESLHVPTRREILQAVFDARSVYFDFVPMSGFESSEIGILSVTNRSGGPITNLSVIEGRIVTSDVLTAHWRQLPGQDLPRTVSVGNKVEIQGRWSRFEPGSTEPQPLEATIELNRYATAEATWQDHLGLWWTTDNLGGIAQLDFPSLEID